ncbi:hypothetical protein DPMN_086373 [Dreissena polymorpha]|uniref:Uncharacterized protein n=1 Tax=Dreissena polymorpha TaxID=45954 RepID=A0A9D4KQW1_DREPO|nr:hypothetical protein DPMN_086373 [Dreissena polymorpha]
MCVPSVAAIWNVPILEETINRLSSFFRCSGGCHNLINILFTYSMTHVSDHFREGILSDPPGILHVWVLDTRNQVTLCDSLL